MTIYIRQFISVLIILFWLSNSYGVEKKKVYIDTPNPCHTVEKVKDNKVYLKSSSQACISAIGKALIEVDANVKSVFIYVDGVMWKEQSVKEFDIENIRDLTKESKRLKIEIPDNTHKNKAKELAGQTYQYYLSKEFQAKLKEENQRLKEEVFNKPLKEYYQGAKANFSALPNNERIYIFISSSIPVQTLRNYASYLDKLKDTNVVLVMRGFVDGMKYISPTIAFSKKILEKRPNCSSEECMYSANLIVDPLLFRRYGITKVPAVVYAKGLDVTDIGMSEGLLDNAKVSENYTVYGDVSLEYALEVIHRETKSKTIENLIERLQGAQANTSDGYY